MKRWMTRAAAGAIAAAFSLTAAYWLWNVGPSTSRCFDKETNGIWAGHQWYTGYGVRTGAPVSIHERDEFTATLRRCGIAYVYVHAGPVRPDGTIGDMPGPFFDSLRTLTPNIRYLPWIGGNARSLRLADPSWRRSFLRTLASLRCAGFSGVHLDIEPLTDFHPGYIELLREIRAAFDGNFFISHATRRLSVGGARLPFLSRTCWSPDFYSACMRCCDQTVLMGYDTCLKLKKAYSAYIKYQTVTLLRLASAQPGHRVMIGLPSYEDVPALSDPRVENIANGARGVRAALESVASAGRAFEGVAIYAHWTTDAAEWKQYRAYWLNRPY